MRFGIVVFPGSNCEHDVYHVAKHLLGEEARFLWHKDLSFNGVDCIVLPGGFAHGDYLRGGSMACYSPIMAAVGEFARRGGMVLGICNGFQILTEAHLLPGALVRNSRLKYICRDLYLRVERQDTPFTARVKQGTVVKMPVGHGEGCFYATEEVLRELEQNRQVVFRYCDAAGEVTAESNPNGSLHAIAGICNERGNVVGLMPHPDRCAEEVLGNVQGRRIFDSIVYSWRRERRTRI